MKKYTLIVATLFCLSNIVAAGDCRVRTTYSHPTQSYPTQSYPTQSYPTQHQDYYNTLILSKAFRIAVDPDYYNFSTLSIPAQMRIFKELEDSKYSREQRSAAQNEYESTTNPRQQAPAQAQPQPKTQVAYTGKGIDPALRSLIKAKCVSCHADGANNINLSDNYLDKVSSKEWEYSAWKVSKNLMPKDGEPLADAEFKLFETQADKALALK